MEIDGWLMARRLALRGQATQALRHLLHETSAFSLAATIGYARQLLKLEPLDESACGQLMTFLAQNGQRDEALWHYQRYQRALTEIWTTAEPSENLVLLAAKIQLGLQTALASPAHKAAQDHVPTARQRIATEPTPAKERSMPVVNCATTQQGIAADQNQILPSRSGATDSSAQAEVRGKVLHFPATLKPLIGRTRERQQVTNWLDLGYRLISVTGLGGVGKSHFVRTVIAEEQQRWRNGALFVTLPTSGGLTNKDERPRTEDAARHAAATTLCRTLAAALNLSLQPHQDYAEQLLTALRPYDCCIVLDNFEAFLAAAPDLQRLLAQAGRVTLVITSRLPLPLAAVVNVMLTGLPLTMGNGEHEHGSHAQLFAAADGTALALLLHNLARHLPSFEPQADDLLSLRRICHALHGLPLALEMVPTLARRYTLAMVANKLENEPLTLTADFGDLPPEQRSLYAVMDAGFATATPALQEAVVRLALFTGPFMDTDAHCVISSTLFDSLRQQGWVETLDQGRFTLHPLIVAFARGQCVDLHWAQVYQSARRQHADYFAERVASQPFLVNSDHTQSIAWLHRHFDQVANATGTLLEQEPSAALNLLRAIAIHGYHYGDLQRVQQWLHQGLTLISKSAPGYLRLLLDYASCATELTNFTEAATALAAARAHLGETPVNEELFVLYERLGWEAHFDYAAESPQRRRDGYSYFSQALLLAEEVGKPQQIVKMLIQRAFLACWETSAHAQAHKDMIRAVQLAHNLDQEGLLGNVYKMFAYVEYAAGRHTSAQRYSDQAIKLLQDASGMTMTLGWLYAERCQIALTQQDVATANHYGNLALAAFEPASFAAGIAQVDAMLGLVALLTDDLATADQHWRRAYAAANQMSRQDKVLTMATIGIGLIQLETGDQILGSALVAAAAAKYQARAFHWVQPEQAFIETLLARAAVHSTALAGSSSPLKFRADRPEHAAGVSINRAGIAKDAGPVNNLKT
jgi:predicted ATPase